MLLKNAHGIPVYGVLLSVLGVAACLGPSQRRTIDLPDGKTIQCIEPPPDVMRSEVAATVNAHIPKLREIIESSLTSEQKFARIRAEVPNLQAWEVLEYRLCSACAQGLVTVEQYQEFWNYILPRIIRDAPCGEGPGILIYQKRDARDLPQYQVATDSSWLLEVTAELRLSMKKQACFEVELVHNGQVLDRIPLYRGNHVGDATYHEMGPVTITQVVAVSAGQMHDFSLRTVAQPATNPDTTNPRYTLIIKRLASH